MTIQKFNFGDRAPTFDAHISSSIPGLNLLGEQCVKLSRRFIQDGSTVIDVGCSTGKLLDAVRRYNIKARSSVRYVGIDIEPKFQDQWDRRRGANLHFEVGDIREFSDYRSLSLAISAFTLQFLPEPDKMPLLRRLHSGLRDGGATIIAQKALASTARLQDALTFPFYDHKAKYFSAEDILRKEQELRGQMTLWSEDELRSKLREVGFREIELIWASFPFIAMLALK